MKKAFILGATIAVLAAGSVYAQTGGNMNAPQPNSTGTGVATPGTTSTGTAVDKPMGSKKMSKKKHKKM
jgi:hypothetical protein